MTIYAIAYIVYRFSGIFSGVYLWRLPLALYNKKISGAASDKI